ncbi:MAG: NADH-quinone oxidoreductase subunit L [Chloroflexi bacterium]|nr:NADH-quinone oxidoreductase subunit L [Chloroflexota bacterium]
MNLELFVWLIPLPPLLAFFIILLFTRGNKRLSDIVAIASIVLTWVLSLVVFFSVLGIEHFGETVIESAVTWLPLGPTAETSFRMGVLVDPLTAVLLFFVPLTATMIFIYSSGYMASGHYWTAVIPSEEHESPEAHGAEAHAAESDNGHGHDAEVLVDDFGQKVTRFDATAWKARFMAFISLFAAGMLILTVADNLLALFAGWEIMGFCSYALISFWHNRVYPNQPKRITPNIAGIKAFMTTRAADVVMLLGIVWLWSYTGTLNFREILYDPEPLAALANPAFPHLGIGLSVGGAIGLLLFAGTVGKSAQFPLHTWLPDAMEGPTPVSAMIHAATMVSAGVYMIIRMFPLLTVGFDGHTFTPTMIVIATIGAFTALFAATIALAQRDIKKVLAYSTISQLGYMVAAVGIGAYVAAAFHLMTHAIFKALLFMGSGSVIHAMEHGEEHAHEHGHHFPLDFDAQDMFNMGGLWRRIPATAWTFLIGGLALAGFPFVTAGFWSKDEILADAWAHAPIVFVVLAIAAFLTAFYTMRQIGLTFAGEPRTAAAEEATQTDWRMNLPLIVLAFFSIIAGWIGIPVGFLGLDGIFRANRFHDFVAGSLLEHPETLQFNWIPLITSIVVALAGLGLGWLMYVRRPLRAGEEDPLLRVLGPFYNLFANKYYIDEAYDFLFVRPSQWFARNVSYLLIDRGIIDGIIHFIARSTEWWALRNKDFDTYVVNGGADEVVEGIGGLSNAFKYVQSGRLQQYLAVVLTGVLMLAGIFIWAIFLR